MLLAEAIADFLADQEIAGRALWTRKKHKQELERLGAWLTEHVLCWETVTRRELKNFIRLRARLGASARASMICSLRVFYRWALAEDLVSASPAEGFTTPSRPKPLPRSLTRPQVRALLAYLAEHTGDGLREARDRVLIATALYTGFRAQELARLVWADLDESAGLISVVLSKGGKGRVMTMHPAIRPLIAQWRITQGRSGQGPVFSLTGDKIAPARVGKIVRGYKQLLGLPLTAHVLRHTWATWTLRKSKNIYAVSKGLGHEQLKQTEIYARADVEDFRSDFDSLPGLGEW